jgi:hypothetical protein
MATLFFSVSTAPSYAAEVDVLINKLVEKGIQNLGQNTKMGGKNTDEGRLPSPLSVSG